MNVQIITWLLGLIAAFLGVQWKTSAKENQDLKLKLSSKKEELYTRFIQLYMDVMNEKITPENDKIVEKMRELNKEMLLVASNKVFLTYGDLMQNFFRSPDDTKQSIRLFGELILAMREDLGHKDWKNHLYWFDSIRPWIKDSADYTPEKYRGRRRYYNNTVNPIDKKID